MLATGAAPVRPPLPGIDLPGIFALRNLDDVDHIHAWIGRRAARQAVIVGAGYIGLEMAENLTRRGLTVTLLEMAGQVMPPADPEMVAPIEQELRRQGVDLRLGDAVAGFEPGPSETITVLYEARRAAASRSRHSFRRRQTGYPPGPRGGPGDRPDRRHPRRRSDAPPAIRPSSLSATRWRSASSSPACRR